MRKNQSNIEADAYLACKSDRFKYGCFEFLEDEKDAVAKMEKWWLDEKEPWEGS